MNWCLLQLSGTRSELEQAKIDLASAREEWEQTRHALTEQL